MPAEINDDLGKSIEALVAALNTNTDWTGKTTRELRDKVELVASKTEESADKIFHATISNMEAIQDLTQAITRNAEANNKVSSAMMWLTVLLTAATVLQAVVAYMQFTK